MSLRVLIAFALVTAGCQRTSADDPTPAASASTSAAASTTAAPAPSAAPSASSSAPRAAGLPPPATIVMTCCMMDRAEGQFGTRGVITRYAGDYLRRKDGERLLFPQDLISDTKELFQHAKSAGRSVVQERHVRPVGEGPRFVSVEIEEQGETGALLPFVHSACKTVELRSGRTLALEDVVGKEAAGKAVEEGKARFAEQPQHDDYRFLQGSFAIVGAEAKPRTVRFCSPRRREELGGARLDVEVTLP